jgi:hypothetical protein
MKKIMTTNGTEFTVSDADYSEISKHNWMLDKKGYVYRTRKSQEEGVPVRVRLHRQILNVLNESCLVDHIDGNRLNNTRDNLRICDFSGNARNMGKPSHGLTSIYKGVSFSSRHKKFQCGIKLNGKKAHIGLFNDELTASMAYDQIARIIHGEFARLNHPDKNIKVLNTTKEFGIVEKTRR